MKPIILTFIIVSIAILSMGQNISDIKSKAEETDIDYEKLLEIEKENKDRKTLKSWLESRIEEEG